VPGVMLFLGLGTGAALHSTAFRVDDRALEVGVQAFLSILKNENDVTFGLRQLDPRMKQLFRKKPFDRREAEEILRQIPDIDYPVVDAEWHQPTTYLKEAAEALCIDGVRLLLEMGADPNCPHPEILDESLLHDMAYPFAEEEDLPICYEIAKLLLQYGANPNIKTENQELFENMEFDIWEQHAYDDIRWQHTVRINKLLVAYGGSPTFKVPLDIDRIDDYKILFRPSGDGYHIEGRMIDPDGVDLGEL